jgi:hypothetical protein
MRRTRSVIYGGYAALEMLFHERSHEWGRMLFDGVSFK